MGNIYEFPGKRTELAEELEFSVAIKKHYEKLGEPLAVVSFAYEYAKSLASVKTNEILFSVDISAVKNDDDAKHIHKQIQEGITNISTGHNAELLNLKAKLVNAQVKIYKFGNDLKQSF